MNIEQLLFSNHDVNFDLAVTLMCGFDDKELIDLLLTLPKLAAEGTFPHKQSYHIFNQLYFDYNSHLNFISYNSDESDDSVELSFPSFGLIEVCANMVSFTSAKMNYRKVYFNEINFQGISDFFRKFIAS